MGQNVRAVVEECTRASDEGRSNFPDTLAKLRAAGVERYHADLVAAEKVYYAPDGAHRVPAGPVTQPFAVAFSAAGVEAAVRASQSGAISYRTFCARVADAGCVGYLVSLQGKRVVYYGRTGETHVELIPS